MGGHQRTQLSVHGWRARPRPSSQVRNADDHSRLPRGQRCPPHDASPLRPDAPRFRGGGSLCRSDVSYLRSLPTVVERTCPKSRDADPVPDLASGTYRPSLISTKPSFCALSPIGVNRGYGCDAQRLLGTRIPGWTFPVVAMTAEPKPHNSTVF